MQNERRIHKSGSRNTGYSGGRLCSQHPGNCKKSKRNEPGGARILVFPELCITGYTCQDLFQQDTLLESAKSSF